MTSKVNNFILVNMFLSKDSSMREDTSHIENKQSCRSNFYQQSDVIIKPGTAMLPSWHLKDNLCSKISNIFSSFEIVTWGNLLRTILSLKMGTIFTSSQMWESNPERLGGKCELYLWAEKSQHISKFLFLPPIQIQKLSLLRKRVKKRICGESNDSAKLGFARQKKNKSILWKNVQRF